MSSASEYGLTLDITKALVNVSTLFFWSGSFLRPLLLYADGLEDLHFSSGHSFHVFPPLLALTRVNQGFPTTSDFFIHCSALTAIREGIFSSHIRVKQKPNVSKMVYNKSHLYQYILLVMRCAYI